MQIALILFYPLLVHISVVMQTPYLRAAALVVLALAILYRPLKRASAMAWVLLLAVAAGSVPGLFFGFTGFVLYLPPVVIPVLLLTVFGETLRPGHTPLVTAIGEKARGPLPAEMRRYTRAVTLMWCLVFASMATVAAALPWLASQEIWSLFTNLLNYVFVGVLLFAEFLYRKYRFPDHDHPNLQQYIKIVISANIGKRHGRD